MNSTILKMLKILFPDTRDTVITEASSILDKYGKKFGCDTNLRIGHFLAQVAEECGSELKPTCESLNYTVDGLKLFKYFRDNPKEAEKYGRTKTQKANQVAIANLAYGTRMGNDGADSNGNGVLDVEDDGYKYRGRFCLQVTGEDNYTAVQQRLTKYAPEFKLNILTASDVEMTNNLEVFFLGGLAFWIWQDIYKQADLGTTDKAVDAVTSVINKHTESYADRRKHFSKIKHLCI